MSQRNPMNDRYQSDSHRGSSRKSAASAKPKSKAASSVTYTSKKKSPKERKAELKAQRKAESARQRELDKKYYTPDTDRYKKLRRIWWVLLALAVLSTIGAFLLRQIEPAWLSIACLLGAYVFIILAFFIDFSKIRKERRAYQTRMLALEAEQARQAQREETAAKSKSNKKR